MAYLVVSMLLAMITLLLMPRHSVHTRRRGCARAEDADQLCESVKAHTFRLNCRACGEVNVPVDQIVLRVYMDDSSARYRFGCPQCYRQVSNPASEELVSMFVANGIRQERWWLRPIGRQQHSGPPFETDDLIDFHFILEGEAANQWLWSLPGVESK